MQFPIDLVQLADAFLEDEAIAALSVVSAQGLSGSWQGKSEEVFQSPPFLTSLGSCMLGFTVLIIFPKAFSFALITSS